MQFSLERIRACLRRLDGAKVQLLDKQEEEYWSRDVSLLLLGSPPSQAPSCPVPGSRNVSLLSAPVSPMRSASPGDLSAVDILRCTVGHLVGEDISPQDEREAALVRELKDQRQSDLGQAETAMREHLR